MVCQAYAPGQPRFELILPHPMVNTLTATTEVVHALPDAAILGLLCLYAVVALAAGPRALTHRDV